MSKIGTLAFVCPVCKEKMIPVREDDLDKCRECGVILSLLPQTVKCVHGKPWGSGKCDYCDSCNGACKADMEEMSTTDTSKALDFRRKFVEAMQETLKTHLENYVTEAEHQDGLAYWLQFADAEEACKDFATYLGNLEDR